jgi:hypothetical protein
VTGRASDQGVANKAALRDNNDMSTDDQNSAPPGVKKVELKVTLGPAQVDAGLGAFELDPAAAERRRIWFCERLDAHGGPTMLPLLARGIILRVRQHQDRSGESTLKLRGPEGCIDPDLWRRRTDAFGKDARIEGDWVTDRHLVAASLDSDVEVGRIDEVVAGLPHRVRRLLSDAQAALAAELLLGLGGLELLGPIRARKWDPGAGGLGAKVAAELWEIDEGPRFLELSMRVDVDADPGGLQRRLEETVRDAGLEIGSEQETKTKTVLTHFAKVESPRP